MLAHDPTLLERRDLLDGILAAAALSIEMVRLRVEELTPDAQANENWPQRVRRSFRAR